MSGHVKLRPSAAGRWMKCTMAPVMEANFPDQSSEYAAEGSEAHRFAERWAARAVGIPMGLVPQDFPPDQEMLDAVEFYANYIKELYREHRDRGEDPAVFLEQRVDLEHYIPGSWGTADCLIVAENTLHVIDFKYGKGVAVEAYNNPQMSLYALGALEWAELLYDISDIVMTIVQPRLGGLSSFAVTAGALKAWGEQTLKPIAQEAASGTGHFCPGEDTCKFCKASGSCKAQADYYVSLFEEGENEGLLTIEETADLLTRSAGMKTWLLSIEDAVFNALMDGERLEGWKLVEGRSTRKYTDEAEIAKRLRAKKYKAADLYEKKLIGISKMEKLVGKTKLAEICGDLIEKPEGKPTLAPASDKRPALNREEDIKEAFDDV